MLRRVSYIVAAVALAAGCGSSSSKGDDTEATDDAKVAAAKAKVAKADERVEFVKLALVDNPTPPAARAQPRTRIRARLSVKATSWRTEGAFPIELEMRGQLAKQGVDVVDADDVAGTVSVVYKAGKYNSYVIEDYYSGTRETKSGSRITIRVSVTPADKSKKKISFSLEAQTDEYFYGGYGTDPHQNAIERLRTDRVYDNIGGIVAAVLGSGEARRQLYTQQMREAGDYDQPIADIAEKLAFEPADDTEKAFAAAAKKDWKACAELGLACAPAIATYFGPGGYYFGNDLTEQAQLIAAIGAIGAIGGREAVDALIAMMQMKTTSSGPMYTMASGNPAINYAWMSALVDIGHPHALFALSRLALGYLSEIAEAAKTGRAKLVAKLQERPRAKGKVAVDVRSSPTHSRTPNLAAFVDNAIRRAKLEPVAPSEPADGYFLVEYIEPTIGDDLNAVGSISVIAVALDTGKVFGPLVSPVYLDGDQINLPMLQQSAMANAIMTIADCAFAACRVPEALELFLSEDYYATDRVRELMERSGKPAYPSPRYPDSPTY